MKQAKRNKGFSLIELIVVIAVIAAIAAVIVPQFTNITGAAKNASDQRNAQMWNEVYANVYSIASDPGATGVTGANNLPATGTTYNSGDSVPAIDVTVNASGANMSFTAPTFNITGDKAYTFNTGEGLN